MDRRARVSRRGAAVALATALLACGAPTPAGPTGARVTVVARGTLGYAVAFAGERLVTVELAERFELVIRDGATGDGRRVDLGPPERDWPALTVQGARAWVGGDAGEVREIDLATGATRARWPVGAPVTALASTTTLVAIGDAEGVLCLRRAGDGALLQCLTAHADAIDTIDVDDDEQLVTRTSVAGATPEVRAWRLPALAPAQATPAPRRWGGRELVIAGRTVDVRRGGARTRVVAMAGEVRAVAVGPDGRLAVAAWIAQLDQASIVLVGWPP